MNANLMINGQRMNDKEVANYIYNNLKSETKSAIERVNEQVEFIIANFENVNDLNVELSVEYLWANIIGIYNKNIETQISNKVKEEIANGRVVEW